MKIETEANSTLEIRTFAFDDGLMVEVGAKAYLPQNPISHMLHSRKFPPPDQIPQVMQGSESAGAFQ